MGYGLQRLVDMLSTLNAGKGSVKAIHCHTPILTNKINFKELKLADVGVMK